MACGNSEDVKQKSSFVKDVQEMEKWLKKQIDKLNGEMHQ